MRRRCESLMALQPGPPAYDAANPDPLRCCERETWFFDDEGRGTTTLCTIVLRKRTRRIEPCPDRSVAAGTSTPRRSQPTSEDVLDQETREPMRVVRVAASGPDGEAEEIGTVETLGEAGRIAGSAGWYRVYGSHALYDCLSVQLNYTRDGDRKLWVSDSRGEYGEPLTLPVVNAAEDAAIANRHFLHQIVRLADPPGECAHCGAGLLPGADCWRACNREGELGVYCGSCARPPIWWDPDPAARSRFQESGRSRKAKHELQTAGHNADGTSWKSPADPLFQANHYVHQIVSLADSPVSCARCDGTLQPGTDSWYAYNEERDFGSVCHECAENYGLNFDLRLTAEH